MLTTSPEQRAELRMLSTGREKAASILACPHCKQSIAFDPQGIRCRFCEAFYSVHCGLPILIGEESEVRQWYRPRVAGTTSAPAIWKRKVRLLLQRMTPPDRVWTRKSQETLLQALRAKNPDAPQSKVILLGAGIEPVFKRSLQPYRSIIRVGLAHKGEIDVACDVCDLPFMSDTADMIMSSSVLEHVYDPERAAAEMHRILRSGGYVYAEIPFMRGYHMEPVDYQRYTISGIERLFLRHGFTTIDKGICSGPFTGLALFFYDLFRAMFSFNRYTAALSTVVLGNLLHPLKYLDRLCENSKWAATNACNFYYLGKKGRIGNASAASLLENQSNLHDPAGSPSQPQARH